MLGRFPDRRDIDAFTLDALGEPAAPTFIFAQLPCPQPLDRHAGIRGHDIPDRLPSLINLVGFWIPPAVAGWVAAASLERGSQSNRIRFTYAVLAAFVLGYAAAWFYYNLGRMPPYVPGATMDPTLASPRAA